MAEETKLDTLFYDLELHTKQFDTRMASVKKTLRDLTKDGSVGITLGAETKQAESALKSAAKATKAVAAEADDLGKGFSTSGAIIDGVSKRIGVSLTNPLAATAALTTALVGITIAATKMAADVDVSFRQLDAALPNANTNLGVLRTEIADLSTVTPRTQKELAGLAASLAKVGESDPAEIARDLRTITLAADALGLADASGLVDTLDLLADGFDLTSEGARQALVQIVAITKGKIGIDELTGTLDKAGTKLNALGITAVDAARGVTALLDAGVNRRQVTTGLVAIIDEATTATARALAASDSNREGDAQALRIFADTVNQTTIATNGLLPTLATLYDRLDGSKEKFQQAGLGLNEYQIAQKAAAAATEDAAKPIETYEQNVARLTESADLNRQSAESLSTLLKNELGAVLIDLGNNILPPVLAGLTALADLFSSARRAARDAAEETARANQLFREGRDGFGAKAGIGVANTLAKRPAIVETASLDQLRNFQAALRSTQFSGNGGGEVDKQLAAVEAQITKLAPALGVITATLPKTTTGFTNTGTAAASAAEKFTTLLTAASAYATSLREADNPIAAAIAKQKELVDALTKTRDSLKGAARAKADGQLNAAIAELNAGIDVLRAQKGDELVQRINTAITTLSGNAVDTLRIQFEQLERETLKNADAAEKLGTAEGAAAATRARNSIPAIRKQAEALIDLTQKQEAFEKITKVGDSLGQQSGIAGITLRVFAVTKLREQETALRATMEDTTQSVTVREKAERQLTAVVAERQKLEGKTQPVASTADAVMKLGVGMRAAAQDALVFVQALGKGGTALAQIISGVGTIGSGLQSAGAAAKAAGGFDKALGSASGIASLIPGIGSIVAGTIAAVQGLGIGKGKSTEEQRTQQIAEENTAAVQALTKNIGELTATTLAVSKLNRVQGALGKLEGAFQTGSKDLRIGNLPDDAKLNVTAFLSKLGLSMKDLEDVAKPLGIQLDGTVGSFRSLSVAIANLPFRLLGTGFDDITKRLDLLSLITGKANDPLDQLANKFRALVPLAPKLAELFNIDELDTKEGRDRLRAQVAKLLKDGLNLDPNSPEAKEFQQLLGNLSPQEFLALFGDILKGFDGFVEAADGSADKLREFNDLARALGVTGLAYVNGLVSAYANTIKEVAGLTDGLDVTTAEGLAALKQRVADIITTLSDNGITDAEQKIVDALFSIVDAAESAATGIDSAAARIAAVAKDIAKAFADLDSTNTILGGDAKTRFRRSADATVNSQGITPELEAILSNIDINTAAGIAAGRKKLQDLYADLAKDGISESEQIVVDFIKNLLGDLDAVAEEGTTSLAQKRANRISGAGRDVAVNDLEGLDAFKVILDGYGETFSTLFSTFDLSTLNGVKGAKKSLSDFFAQIRDMSDADVYAQFGVSKDELLAGIDAMDNGLDGLSGSLQNTAAATAAATKASDDFLYDLNQTWLEATGQGLQAQLNVIATWVDNMIAEAERLGIATDAIKAQIRAIGASRVATATANAAQQSGQASAAQAEAQRQEQIAYERGLFEGQGTKSGALDTFVKAVEGAVLNPTQNFVASDITAATGTQVLRMTDYLAQLLQENQTLVALSRRLVELISSAIGGPLPALRVPSFTPLSAVSGPSAAPPITLVFNLHGPLTGLTPQEAMRQLAEAAAPYISAIIARDAGTQARNAGSPTLN